jgi:hypothetical protein
MEWLVIDKAGDHLYFKQTAEIAKYFNLTIPQVNAVYIHSLNNINKYSPSKDIYIQRLYNNVCLPPKDFKKTSFHWYALKYIYPNILNE